MKPPGYEINQRVEYIAHETVRAFGFRKTMIFHKVGYIKRIVKTLFGYKYWLVRANKNDGTGRMDEVRQSDIIGPVAEKERKQPVIPN